VIRDNLILCRERIARAAARSGRCPEEVTLLAVTKGVGARRIEEAIVAGVDLIGESRLQEAFPKYDRLDRFAQERGAGLRWHLVGHLQTNKAREAVRIFDVIHSVDSLRVAEAIERHAARMQKVQQVFLEVNVSAEAAKYGFAADEVAATLASMASLAHLRVTGLMTVAPLVEDPEEARPVFRRLRELRDGLNAPRPPQARLRELSMGMTDDFEVAVEEGSTVVRLGRALFGERT